VALVRKWKSGRGRPARTNAVPGENRLTSDLLEPRNAAASRWLVVFALGYGLLHHVGAVLSPLGSVGVTRWADWAEMGVPYAVLLPAAAALVTGGASRWVWAVYLVGAITYAEGAGIHLAANSIGNVDPGTAVHLWDEVIGHYAWYTGVVLVVVALASTFARQAPAGKIGPYALAALVGITHATNSLEGGTVVFGVLAAAVLGGWGWVTRAGLGRLLLVAYALALLLLAGYGSWHGGFPQPSGLP
jgi:hypothetical protein